MAVSADDFNNLAEEVYSLAERLETIENWKANQVALSGGEYVNEEESVSDNG